VIKNKKKGGTIPKGGDRGGEKREISHARVGKGGEGVDLVCAITAPERGGSPERGKLRPAGTRNEKGRGAVQCHRRFLPIARRKSFYLWDWEREEGRKKRGGSHKLDETTRKNQDVIFSPNGPEGGYVTPSWRGGNPPKRGFERRGELKKKIRTGFALSLIEVLRAQRNKGEEHCLLLSNEKKIKRDVYG